MFRDWVASGLDGFVVVPLLPFSDSFELVFASKTSETTLCWSSSFTAGVASEETLGGDKSDIVKRRQDRRLE